MAATRLLSSQVSIAPVNPEKKFFKLRIKIINFLEHFCVVVKLKNR